MIDEKQQDQAALHALGMLQGPEAAEFQAAAKSDPELLKLSDELADAATEIVHALPSAKAPAEVLPRLLTRIRAERMHSAPQRASEISSSPGWMPWALAASLAVAAAVGYLAGWKVASVSSDNRIAKLNSQIDQADIERQRLANLVTALKDERVSLEKRVADLRQRDLLSQIKIATLKVQVKKYAAVAAYAVWDAAAQQGVMRFANLPPAPAGKDYQMWIIDPKSAGPVSAGIFTSEGGGEFSAAIKPSRPIAMADKFAVSLEPQNGSASPRGEIFLMSN